MAESLTYTQNAPFPVRASRKASTTRAKYPSIAESETRKVADFAEGWETTSGKGAGYWVLRLAFAFIEWWLAPVPLRAKEDGSTAPSFRGAADESGDIAVRPLATRPSSGLGGQLGTEVKYWGHMPRSCFYSNVDRYGFE